MGCALRCSRQKNRILQRILWSYRTFGRKCPRDLEKWHHHQAAQEGGSWGLQELARHHPTRSHQQDLQPHHTAVHHSSGGWHPLARTGWFQEILVFFLIPRVHRLWEGLWQSASCITLEDSTTLWHNEVTGQRNTRALSVVSSTTVSWQNLFRWKPEIGKALSCVLSYSP